MSNAPTSSPKSGDSRRRSSRSRGGKSRSNNSSGSKYNNRSQRSEEYRPQGPRPPRNAPVVKLSWWQKLLQAIGLYKAPTAKSTSNPSNPAPSPRSSAPTKSNTRNARSGTSTDEPTEVKPKRSPRNDSRSRGGDPATVESARVYVGNLSYDVTEHDLEELFKGVGGVRGVEIVYNRATHRSKGYGFVEMLHKDEAMRSVEVLHDQPFMGRKLIVSGAKARGADDREEQDGREESEERVVVAPVPAAAVVSTMATEETVIETVIETTTDEPVAESVEEPAEAPAAEASEAPAEEERSA
jgi:hypothetical protein